MLTDPAGDVISMIEREKRGPSAFRPPKFVKAVPPLRKGLTATARPWYPGGGLSSSAEDEKPAAAAPKPLSAPPLALGLSPDLKPKPAPPQVLITSPSSNSSLFSPLSTPVLKFFHSFSDEATEERVYPIAMFMSARRDASHTPHEILRWCVSQYVKVPSLKAPPHLLLSMDSSDDGMGRGTIGSGLTSKTRAKPVRQTHHKVMSVLSRITPQKYSELLEELLQLPLRQADDAELYDIAKVFFDKAVQEHEFSGLYAQLASELCTMKENEKELEAELRDRLLCNRMRRQLITTCQEQFRRPIVLSADEMVDRTTGRPFSEEEIDMKRTRMKNRVVGNVKFVGELFKMSLVTVRVVEDILQLLVGDYNPSDALAKEEYVFEVFATLIKTVGPLLKEQEPHILSHFLGIANSVQHSHPRNRVHFQMMDLEDLNRKNNWIPQKQVLRSSTSYEDLVSPGSPSTNDPSQSMSLGHSEENISRNESTSLFKKPVAGGGNIQQQQSASFNSDFASSNSHNNTNNNSKFNNSNNNNGNNHHIINNNNGSKNNSGMFLRNGRENNNTNNNSTSSWSHSHSSAAADAPPTVRLVQASQPQQQQQQHHQQQPQQQQRSRDAPAGGRPNTRQIPTQSAVSAAAAAAAQQRSPLMAAITDVMMADSEHRHGRHHGPETVNIKGITMQLISKFNSEDPEEEEAVIRCIDNMSLKNKVLCLTWWLRQVSTNTAHFTARHRVVNLLSAILTRCHSFKPEDLFAAVVEWIRFDIENALYDECPRMFDNIAHMIFYCHSAEAAQLPRIEGVREILPVGLFNVMMHQLTTERGTDQMVTLVKAAHSISTSILSGFQDPESDVAKLRMAVENRFRLLPYFLSVSGETESEMPGTPMSGGARAPNTPTLRNSPLGDSITSTHHYDPLSQCLTVVQRVNEDAEFILLRKIKEESEKQSGGGALWKEEAERIAMEPAGNGSVVSQLVQVMKVIGALLACTSVSQHNSNLISMADVNDVVSKIMSRRREPIFQAAAVLELTMHYTQALNASVNAPRQSTRVKPLRLTFSRWCSQGITEHIPVMDMIKSLVTPTAEGVSVYTIYHNAIADSELQWNTMLNCLNK